MSLIEDIKQEEGFMSMPYKDHLGFDTIGYGSKLPLTRTEAELLLSYRLQKFQSNIKSSLYDLDAPDEVWEILYHMAYQIGVAGLLKFKKMIEALRNKDYVKASDEMLDSLWAKQTPNRAKRLSDKMRKVG